MDMSTTYMGLKLKHPFMPGASPMVDDLDTVRRLIDAGASAIVMHSLFEEQILAEQLASVRADEELSHSFSEAMTFLADNADFTLEPDEYMEQIARIKRFSPVPVIASLNGTTEGSWLHYATMLQQAGADAIELNLFDVTTDASVSARDVEQRQVQLVRAVRKAVSIPLAVKMSSTYTSPANMAHEFSDAGVNGLVVFNRYYQPDIDIEELEMFTVNLSSRAELPLRLRWLGIIHGQVDISLAVSGGVHHAADAVKAIMCGASAVQMVSVLLRLGPDHLRNIVEEVRQWLEEHEYESLQQLRGSMSMKRCPDPMAYRRANYVRILQSWR